MRVCPELIASSKGQWYLYKCDTRNIAVLAVLQVGMGDNLLRPSPRWT